VQLLICHDRHLVVNLLRSLQQGSKCSTAKASETRSFPPLYIYSLYIYIYIYIVTYCQLLYLRALLPPLAVTRQPTCDKQRRCREPVYLFDGGWHYVTGVRVFWWPSPVDDLHSCSSRQSPLTVEVKKVNVQRRRFLCVGYSLVLAEVWTSRRFTWPSTKLRSAHHCSL